MPRKIVMLIICMFMPLAWKKWYQMKTGSFVSKEKLRNAVSPAKRNKNYQKNYIGP